MLSKSHGKAQQGKARSREYYRSLKFTTFGSAPALSGGKLGFSHHKTARQACNSIKALTPRDIVNSGFLLTSGSRDEKLGALSEPQNFFLLVLPKQRMKLITLSR